MEYANCLVGAGDLATLLDGKSTRILPVWNMLVGIMVYVLLGQPKVHDEDRLVLFHAGPAGEGGLDEI